MQEVRLLVVRDDDDLVPLALGQPGKAKPTLPVGLGLQSHDADIIRPGETVTSNLGVREDLSCLGVFHDAFDQSAGCRGVGEVSPVDRLISRAVLVVIARGRERIDLPRNHVDRRASDHSAPELKLDDPIGPNAVELESAVLIGCHLTQLSARGRSCVPSMCR